MNSVMYHHDIRLNSFSHCKVNWKKTSTDILGRPHVSLASTYFFVIPQVDYEMALDYAMQSGVSEEPREAIYLNSLEGSYKFVDFQSPVFVFRFIP